MSLFIFWKRAESDCLHIRLTISIVLRFIRRISTIHSPFNLVCRQSLLALFQKLNNDKPLFQEDFFLNRRTLFGSLRCRQTLFKAQILFHKAFYDFFRFTRPSKIVNAFPSFAMHLREANLRPTYLSWTKVLSKMYESFRYKKCRNISPLEKKTSVVF